VAVIEQKDRLEGYTRTYANPGTGKYCRLWVHCLAQFDIFKSYFEQLNGFLVKANSVSVGVTKYADFRTGVVDSEYSPTDSTAALDRYSAQLFKYLYVEEGFHLPHPVPSDLLFSFGEYVKKYNLEDLVRFIFWLAQRLGDLLTQPTM
jgi:hypothetical protein